MDRTRTPPDLETAVLFKSARRCTLCFHLSCDLSEKLGQIAHLDKDPSNSAEDNLAFMCLDHHSLFDSRTSQHKNYALQEVKTARNKLYEAITENRHGEKPAPMPVMYDLSGPNARVNINSVDQSTNAAALVEELARSAREQAASAGQQLRLLAHPNPVVEVRADRDKRSVFIKIINRGAYPFRLDNAEINAMDDEGKPFTRKLCELCGGVIVGSNDNARTWVFLHEAKIELDSGAFQDWVQVEFDCEDAIGLAKKRYSYCNVTGLREI